MHLKLNIITFFIYRVVCRTGSSNALMAAEVIVGNKAGLTVANERFFYKVSLDINKLFLSSVRIACSSKTCRNSFYS